MPENPVLWTPSKERVRNSSMYHFMQKQGFDNFDALHKWSIEHSPDFWKALCDFAEVRFANEATTILNQPGDMTTARWFADATISFPEHVLRHSGERAAIVFRGENGVRRQLTFDELRTAVAETSAGLVNAGVVKGDRVAGFLPNCPEAIIAMLASASIGAIWSSCSPDFGINGVVDRFGQIEPKVLFCADGYFYSGKPFRFSCSDSRRS